MINGLFISPLDKEMVHQDENVIYTEDMKTLVVYRPEGVIKYLNLGTKAAANRDKYAKRL